MGLESVQVSILEFDSKLLSKIDQLSEMFAEASLFL